ncbi:MAG: SusE domain-containing protein [Bacteroidota bacterium]|jgi:hypothetical protein|nr:SusE domain-containing protein [Chitinophagaceae bacterium]
MKKLYNLLSYGVAIFLFSLIVSSCEKVDQLPNYGPGTATTLNASANTLAPAVTDSSKTVLTLSWSSPSYSVDSNTVKYIVQMDSAGRNFSKAEEKIITGIRTASFTAKEINAIALGFGFAFNKQYNMELRVVSSHANNNERLFSTAVALKYTPYVTPPKVLPPSSKQLFLVGSATAGGWNNPVPVPSQQFTRVDSVTYEGEFYLKGGQQFLCLPVNGDWSNKYSVKDNNATGLNKGGDFGFNLSDNFPGPDKTGIYKLKMDFQAGKFTVTLLQEIGLLYVPGDYQGWSPASAPQLGSPKKDGVHEGYVSVKEGGSYEFKIAAQPDWSGTVFGDGGAGKLSTSGGNLKFPGAGFFRINANTKDETYSITNTTWAIIGSLTGWSSDISMELKNGVWEGTATVGGREEFKFRANSDWGINLGDDKGDNSLEYGGANIVLPGAGTYKLSLDLTNPGYYTYKISKQ